MARKMKGGAYRESMKGRHMHHTHASRGMSKKPHGRKKGSRY